MTFPMKLLVALVWTTVIYCIGWRIVIAKFRRKVYNLIWYKAWLQINKDVNRFRLKIVDNKCLEIIPLNRDNEPIKLEFPMWYLVNILKHDFLFDWYEVEESMYEGVPNTYFSTIADITRDDIIKVSKTLHERFESYPKLIKLTLDGAYSVLNKLDEEMIELTHCAK